MQYNPYLWTNLPNFRVLKEIGVEEHECYVRFKSESGMAVSCMRNASSHRNSSFIVDRYHVPQNVFLVLLGNKILFHV